ncbi:phosphatidylethanolamine-binding protein [Cyathus striatus]|nr:phosphatidylethanolamine-binding protein [Cyathus striatus]
MNVTQAFSLAQVVPDVVSSFNPTDLMNITFTDAATMQSVNVTPGALLTMEQTAMEPEFFLISNNGAEPSNQTFVLALVDPDAPTPQNTSVSQFLHFLGGDFSANNGSLLTNSTPALMDFFPPTPPAGSDPHRYVLLIFAEPADFDTVAFTFVNSSTPRTNFNLTVFATSVGLDSPIAGNFFLVGPSNSSDSSSSIISSAASSAIVPLSTASSSASLSALPTSSPTSANTSPTTSTSAGHEKTPVNLGSILYLICASAFLMMTMG